MSDTQAMDPSSTTDPRAEAATDLSSVDAIEADGPDQPETDEGGEVGEVSGVTEAGTRDLTDDDAPGDSGQAQDAIDGAEDADGDRDGAGDESGPRKKSRVRQLEREGEVAADFLETLLDIADLDGDIDVDVDGDRAAIAIVDSEEGRVPRRLVGADGRVLEALQELTRLAVQVETGERSRLMLDIAGYRAERRSALVVLAKQSIEQVRESGSKMSLEPMSAFERKVVHDEVSAAGLVSESEGVDPHRHIVILPA